MDTSLFRDIWRTITFKVILTITNAIYKNLPSNSTKWRPIIVYIHFTPEVVDAMNVSFGGIGYGI
jgi:hypothetical protein